MAAAVSDRDDFREFLPVLKTPNRNKLPCLHVLVITSLHPSLPESAASSFYTEGEALTLPRLVRRKPVSEIRTCSSTAAPRAGAEVAQLLARHAMLSLQSWSTACLLYSFCLDLKCT